MFFFTDIDELLSFCKNHLSKKKERQNIFYACNTIGFQCRYQNLWFIDFIVIYLFSFSISILSNADHKYCIVRSISIYRFFWYILDNTLHLPTEYMTFASKSSFRPERNNQTKNIIFMQCHKSIPVSLFLVIIVWNYKPAKALNWINKVLYSILFLLI